MADANTIALTQFKDGTALSEVGTPAWHDPKLQSQNHYDTVKYSIIEIVPDGTVKTAVEYRTGGFPLGDDSGEITPDADTALELYQFSAFVAKALRFTEQDAELQRIVGVHLQTLHVGDPGGTPFNISQCLYDGDNDKLRLFENGGTELATGDVIETEAAEAKLRLLVAWI